MRAARPALFILAVAVAWPAAAQTLYRWTDARGRVQYSDQPPKDFKGEVVRIQAEPFPPPAPPVPPPPDPVKDFAPDPKPGEVRDIAAERRATRERLAGDVARAREKLAAARKALDEAGGPEPGERQVVRQHFAKGTQPANARSNCREVVKDGTPSLMCPALVPSSDYYDRIAKLEAAVKDAEAEVEEAERAYRRGAD